MDAQAVITVSAAVVALAQLAKWYGIPDGKGPIVVMILSALGTALWVLSSPSWFDRTQVFAIFAAWVAVTLNAAGVFGFTRAAASAVTSTVTPPSGAGASPTTKERGRSDVAVVAWLLGILGVVALTVVFAYRAGREAGFELGLFETAKRYSDGLREGAALCAPADPVSIDHCADLAICRERLAELEAEEESNVLAIEAAHERGWEEAYALGRGDWTCQRWERRCP